MPIYEYECAACGERLERLQRMDDPPLVECPACGEAQLRRLISPPAFQFKGSGWYVTDYGRKAGEAGKGKGTDDGEKKGGEEAKAGGGEKATSEKEKKAAAEPTPAKKAERGET